MSPYARSPLNWLLYWTILTTRMPPSSLSPGYQPSPSMIACTTWRLLTVAIALLPDTDARQVRCVLDKHRAPHARVLHFDPGLLHDGDCLVLRIAAPLRPFRILDLHLQLVIHLKIREGLDLIGRVEDESLAAHGFNSCSWTTSLSCFSAR